MFFRIIHAEKNPLYSNRTITKSWSCLYLLLKLLSCTYLFKSTSILSTFYSICIYVCGLPQTKHKIQWGRRKKKKNTYNRYNKMIKTLLIWLFKCVSNVISWYMKGFIQKSHIAIVSTFKRCLTQCVRQESIVKSNTYFITKIISISCSCNLSQKRK